MKHCVSVGLVGVAVLAMLFSACTKPNPTAENAPQEGKPSPTEVPGAPAPTAARPAESRSPKPEPLLSKPEPPKARVATLEAGTRIAVRTTSAISTRTAETGERFEATLAEPIMDGDWVIAPRGATVDGKVVASDPGGRVKGRASLSVQLTSLTLADGRKVPISTRSISREAASTKKKDAAKIGIGAGIGAAIGAIAGGGKGAAIGAGVGGAAGTGTVMATKGDAAVIPSETVLTTTLSAPVRITK